MTTLLITGSRAATPAMLDYAKRAVRRAGLLGWQIVVGDAAGIDTQTICQCCAYGVPFAFYGVTPVPRNCCCKSHRANYVQVQGSYPNRDRYMVYLADRVLGIWNGTSNGTKYTCDHAMRQGKTVWLKTFEAQP